MIKLQGRFEFDEYWEEVRRAGDDRLQESGFDDWVVTLRPPGVADSERAAREQVPDVSISAAKKILDIAMFRQPDLPPQSFVQTSIIDAIEVTGAGGDDAAEDLLRDEGGEA